MRWTYKASLQSSWEIGSATAAVLLARRARVVVSERCLDIVAASAPELGASGDQVWAVVAAVSTADNDILVSNAGCRRAG